MRLFHQLDDTDQHNAIHYCIHLVLDDMLADGVELEPHSEEDKKAKELLEKVIAQAKILPEEEQFNFVMNDNKEASTIVMDIAIDFARGAYYHDPGEMVIFPADLREEVAATTEGGEEVLEELPEEINTKIKKGTHSIN